MRSDWSRLEMFCIPIFWDDILNKCSNLLSIIRMLFFGRFACEAGGGFAGSGHRPLVQFGRKARKLLGPVCYCSLHLRMLPGQLKAHLGNY